MSLWPLTPAFVPRDKQGIVLVSVLWTIALLSALAMAASVSFRSFAGVLAIDRDRVQMDGLLMAGLEAGSDILLKSGGYPPLVTMKLMLPNGIVEATLSDEQGRIDINRAPIDVLVSLFDAIGVENSEKLAQAVVVWRDEHRGLKPAKAQPAATPLQAKQDPDPVFDDIWQLMQIPGMEKTYIDRLVPLTTVFGTAGVNPLTASEEVLFALPLMNAARVEQLEELRRFPQVDMNRIGQVLGPASAFMKGDFQIVARVELTGALSDEYAAAATAIIVVLQKDTQPYRVLAWTPHPIFNAQ